jgi:hypothetical protein
VAQGRDLAVRVLEPAVEPQQDHEHREQEDRPHGQHEQDGLHGLHDQFSAKRRRGGAATGESRGTDSGDGGPKVAPGAADGIGSVGESGGVVMIGAGAGPGAGWTLPQGPQTTGAIRGGGGGKSGALMWQPQRLARPSAAQKLRDVRITIRLHFGRFCW